MGEQASKGSVNALRLAYKAMITGPVIDIIADIVCGFDAKLVSDTTSSSAAAALSSASAAPSAAADPDGATGAGTSSLGLSLSSAGAPELAADPDPELEALSEG